MIKNRRISMKSSMLGIVAAVVMTFMMMAAATQTSLAEPGGGGDKTLTMPALPTYIIEGEEGLSFTVEKPQDAEGLKVNVWFELEGNTEDDELFHGETEEATLSVSVDKAKFKKDMVVKVKAEADGNAYHDEEEKGIPVIAKPSALISISASETNVPVNKDFRVTVNASGDNTIKKVRFFNGRDFWGEDDPDGNGSYRRHISLDEAGTYALFAKVQVNNSSDWLTCEPVTVTATAEGRVGDFSISRIGKEGSSFDGTVTRGDILNIECTEAQKAEHYWVDAEKQQGTNNWKWYDHFADSYGTSIRFNTIGLEPGTYKVSVGADAVGYESSHSDSFELTVSDLTLAGNKMYFDVSKTELDTGEEFEFAAYYPNASWIKVFMNYGEDDNWSRDTHGWDDGNLFMENDCYGNSGTYQLKAVAYDMNDEIIAESEAVGMTVTASKGDLELTAPELPEYLLAGKDDLSFTYVRPDNADNIKARVWFDKEDYEGDNSLYEEETDGDSLEVTIDKDDLQDGMTVRIALEAWGSGYNGVYEEFGIPVIGAVSNTVKIQADKKEVISNDEIEFTVSAGSSNIDKVRFFDGWSLNGEDYPDWEDPTRYTRYHSLDEAGKYCIYAKVKLENSDEWLTTEPVTITVTSNGRVGAFDVTKINGADAGPFEIKRGEIATFECTESEHANHYRIDALKWSNERKDWDWFGSYGDSDQPPVSLGTAEFEPGIYRLMVKANGLGYESYQTAPIEMTVKKSDITGNDMSVEVAKTEALTNENIVFSAYCPNAKRIEYYLSIGGEDDEDWKDVRNGNSVTDTISFDEKGKYDFVVRAYDTENEGGAKIAEVKKEITFTAPNGKLPMEMPELPETICRDDFSFIVNMPENGFSTFVLVWDRSNGDENATGENIIATKRTGKDTLEMKISADKLTGVSKLGVRVIGYGVGYEFADKKYGITVAEHDLNSHPAKAAGCTMPGNSAYWSCDRCGKYFSDSNGSTEIEEDSWVLSATDHAWGEWKESSPSTCIHKGQMERICNNDPEHKEYKDAELSSHKLTRTDAVAATYDSEGNIEYWTCSVCGKIFRDAAGTGEISKADTVTAKLLPKTGDSVKTASGTYVITGASTASFQGAANNSGGTVPDTVVIGGKTYTVTAIGANAFKGSKAKSATIGKNVKTIKAKAFSGSKIKTVTLKTKKLTKKSVKNAFKGSKVKTVKVKVGSKKENKKYVTKYNKFFTKSNVGAKVKVK